MSKKYSKDTPWSSSQGSVVGNLAAVPRVHCYETHTALTFTAAGKEFRIYGGSCSSPLILDADIYVGFDRYSMTYQNPPGYPWAPKAPRALVEFLFPIADMGVPSVSADFKALVDWVCNQLHEGKKIHAGCIGGHGRTGMFLVAVYSQMTGEKDGIAYVRKNYCDHAVESASQVDFLHKHYGVTKANGYKEGMSNQTFHSYNPMAQKYHDMGAYEKEINPPKHKHMAFSESKKAYNPVPSKRCVW